MSYEEIGKEIGKLVEEKQAAYGDSFGKSGIVIRALYPEGIKPEALADALTVVRVVDKLFRIATKKDAFGESPWRDIAGYAILSVKRDEEARRPEGGKKQHEGHPSTCPRCIERGDVPPPPMDPQEWRCSVTGASAVNGKIVRCEGGREHSGMCWNSEWKKDAPTPSASPVMVELRHETRTLSPPAEQNDVDPYEVSRIGVDRSGAW